MAERLAEFRTARASRFVARRLARVRATQEAEDSVLARERALQLRCVRFWRAVLVTRHADAARTRRSVQSALFGFWELARRARAARTISARRSGTEMHLDWMAHCKRDRWSIS